MILKHAKKQLRQKGYSIVEVHDTSEDTLLRLASYFGPLQLHIRSDSNGIVTVSPNSGAESSRIDISKYTGVSSKKHPPHTDGAYLYGFLQEKSELHWINPPALVLLQCVSQADSGGDSIIIDAQKILFDLIENNVELARTLTSEGYAFFCRDDQMALKVSVYENLPSGRYRVRFRSDRTLYLLKDYVPAVREFYERYICNPDYQERQTLRPGQILILDNFRVLHGREAFLSNESGQNRLLRRTWVFDESQSTQLVNFSNQEQTCRGFDRFKPYMPLNKGTSHRNIVSHLGIHLPQSLESALHSRSLKWFPNAS